MFKLRKYIISFTIILLYPSFLFSKPYQLIESESATMIKRGFLEYKINGVYETGYIPTGLGRLGLRYGLFSHFEINTLLQGGTFIDQEEYRVTDLSGTAKYHFWRSGSSGMNMYMYGKYRHTFGDSIIAPVDSDSDEMEDVVSVVSPYADQGRDASAGLLMRNTIFLFSKRHTYMIGLEYTRAMNRDYGDFNDEGQNIGRLLFCPQYHIGYNEHILFAFENNVTYWQTRGYYYSLMPQIRWEFSSFWVMEAGVAVPVVGAGNNYRVVVGMVYGKG